MEDTENPITEEQPKNFLKKWLLQTLILSGILNLLFLAIFFYFLIRENPFPFEFEYAEVKAETIKPVAAPDLLLTYQNLSYDALIEQMRKKGPLLDGYLERDLALAFLVHAHHFHLKRALNRPALSMRQMPLPPSHTLTVYPGLNDEDFKAIFLFLSKEKWPFTSEGLFTRLQKVGVERDPSLTLAFLQTPEFKIVEAMFRKVKEPIKKRWLTLLVLEGKFAILSTFLEEEKKGYDVSGERRGRFLVAYIKGGSKTAAALLLLTDWEMATRGLDDATLTALLDLLPKNSKRGKTFAKEVLTFPRSDLVHAKARVFLGEEEKKELAQIRPPRAAVGELRPKFRDKPPSSPSPQQHVIQQGESLWTIARKYHKSVDQLKRANQLPNNTIKPGKTLKIPA